MKLNIKNTAFIIMAVLTLAACNSNEQQTSENIHGIRCLSDGTLPIHFTTEQYKIAGIETGFVKLRVLGSTLKLNGKIEVRPGNAAQVSAPLGGYVKTSILVSR